MTGYTAFHTFPEHDAVREALVETGLPAVLYQDGTSGGLLCVKVPLTADDSEYAPSLLISSEGETDQFGNVRWFASVDAVGADEQYDLTLNVLQRTGETPADAGRKYATVARLLREGGAAIDTDSSASRQHSIDSGRYLLKGEAYSV